MRRELIDKLTEWKAGSDRKPLIIRGARQVGKTWLMKEFGRLHYKHVAYFNFESSATLKTAFSIDFDIARLLTALRIESGQELDAENTLLIFDEVQESEGALTSLKYFHENAPQYQIVAAGSLLGVAMHQHQSFPVGKVEFVDLYPFSFREFLLATHKEDLLRLLDNKDWPLITVFREKYIESLRQYYFVGGMPEAVSVFTLDKNVEKVREVQLRILAAFEQDFSKHAPYQLVPRMRMIWQSIPSQLARENRKFVYGLLRQGARAKEYELSLAWLSDAGLVHKVHRVSKPGMPLIAYQDLSAFKLYLLDVGLLGAMGNIDATVLLDGNSLFEEFKGAITEQYVLQQLKATVGCPVFYWAAERATAEVDFILQGKVNIIPIEVKAAENLRSKSLQVFHELYHPQRAIRVSMSNYREQDWLTNYPLYAVDQLEK